MPKQPTTRQPEWDTVSYPAAEVARLVGLNAVRVRRWLRGYTYRYEEAIHSQAPVIRPERTDRTTYASFLDLIDLLFVKQFLDHGLSLQRIRKALQEAVRLLGTEHFARSTFFTDGRNVYLKVKNEGDAILELLSGGQWVIAPIIRQLAEQIDFESSTGVARRWYPCGPDGLVVLDPTVSFGRPTLVGRGIATASVYDLYIGENKQIEAAAEWLNLAHREVTAAVAFEERLAA
jgi:uncharacterized protein (DUF433 family)/DNA-binding transcriptional MerR regulator